MSVLDHIADIPEKEVRNQLEQHAFRIERMVDYANTYEIKNQIDAEEAISFAVESRTLFKKIELLRKEITEPARKFINKVNDSAKVFTEKLDKVEEILKAKLDAWKKKKEEEQKLAQKQAEVFAQAMELDVIPYVDEAPKAIRSDNAMTYEKVEWKFDVEDLSKVPMHLLMVDEDKVKQMLRAGIRDIPGLKIYSETKTVIRTR